MLIYLILSGIVSHKVSSSYQFSQNAVTAVADIDHIMLSVVTNSSGEATITSS